MTIAVDVATIGGRRGGGLLVSDDNAIALQPALIVHEGDAAVLVDVGGGVEASLTIAKAVRRKEDREIKSINAAVSVHVAQGAQAKLPSVAEIIVDILY